MKRYSAYFLAAMIIVASVAGFCRADDDLLRSSLLELKNSMQQMIDVNRDLSSRNDRFRSRILELQGQLQEIKDKKQMLIDEKRTMSGASAGELQDGDSLRRTITQLETQLNRFSREYLNLQRKSGGKDEEFKRYQSRHDKLDQEISQLRAKKQHVKSVAGMSDEKKLLTDRIEEIRRKVQSRKQDLQKEQNKSRVPFIELENIREKRRQQKEKLARLRTEWQTIFDEQTRLREKIVRNQSNRQEDLSSLQSEIEVLLSREQKLKNSGVEFVDFKKKIVDGFADDKKDLKNTLDISFKNNRDLKAQIVFLEESLKKLKQLSSAQTLPMRGQEQEEILKKQGNELRLQHIYIQNQITDKKKEADGVAQQVSQFQADINSMTNELIVSQKATAKILEQEKAKYQQWLKRKSLPVAAQKNVVYGEEAKKQQTQKASSLQVKIAALRQELRDLDLGRNDLRKKQLAGQQEGQGALTNLNSEIKNLEQIEEEMAHLLADVEKKYKASRVNFKDLRQDEKQLSQHLAVLEGENQSLQAEVLSLGIAFDKATLMPR